LKTLYVTGEESAKQVKLRAARIGGDDSNCLIYSETLMENILKEAREILPDIMVVDSVQTMFSQYVESSPGSVTQIRETASQLLRFAKETGVPVILIGHITKEGSIAGPKVLEHIVDVVLQFEGDNRGSYRLLRSIKNRFGSTSELAVFEMTGKGLREVSNPSEMLIPMHEEGLSGVAVSAMLDGSRPFLIEVQSLVSSAVYGTPQRSAMGFDVRRLNMLLAVLEKRAGFKLSVKDVFLNMAGGLKVSDPACDMAVIAAVLSSNFDMPIGADVCFAGEVGLSGEIRPVAQTDRRIMEAARLGFKKIFVSSFSSFDGVPKDIAIDVVKVGDVPALCRALFKG
jgi:DNA repair protein RadA/Sms